MCVSLGNRDGELFVKKIKKKKEVELASCGTGIGRVTQKHCGNDFATSRAYGFHETVREILRVVGVEMEGSEARL